MEGPATITRKEFETISELVKDEIGIVLGDSKRALVVSRLASRLRALQLDSFTEYLEYLERSDPRGEERTRFLNRITTNKTEFLREEQHFQYLVEHVLPVVAARAGGRRLRIWSAGCSTGEEPYTIAMVLRENIPDLHRWDVKILASDIDTEVLARASAGIYREELLEQIPTAWVKKYFLRGVGDREGLAKVKPEVAELVEFRRINLIAEEGWPLAQEKFDVIFCRNVVIYFDRPTQVQLFDRFVDHLPEGGHLFVGHSESLHGITDRVAPVRGTVYRRPADGDTARRTRAPEVAMKEARIVVGGVYASKQPARVKTVLGSCVSACLYDPVAKTGGMNHFLLPAGREDEEASTRYGVHAMEMLIDELVKQGADRRRLQAKIFGGAEVLQMGNLSVVPDTNVQFVKRFLEHERIPVVAERCGGKQALEVHFQTHDGRAFVRTLGAEAPEVLGLI